MTLNKCLSPVPPPDNDDEPFRSVMRATIWKVADNFYCPVTHPPDRRPCPQTRRRARMISLAARLDRWGRGELH